MDHAGSSKQHDAPTPANPSFLPGGFHEMGYIARKLGIHIKSPSDWEG
jgi:hypothetical protein